MPLGPELTRSSFQVSFEASRTDICSLSDFPSPRVLDLGGLLPSPLLNPHGTGKQETLNRRELGGKWPQRTPQVLQSLG